MTQLWLVRHGQTDWNRQGRYQGQADPPLNAAGLAQAEALAGQLAASGERFAAIYASDLQRARDTAEVIGAALGLPAKVDARLREINLGRWEGMLAVDIVRQYPAEWAQRERDPWNSPAPGGETPAAVAARVEAAANDIAQAHPAGTVLIVAHGFALATLLCRARGHPLVEVYSLVPPNAHPEVVVWAPTPLAPPT